MPLEPLSRISTMRIVNNIVKVIKSGHIELLSKQAYDYLYLCSGFIAHYNHNGFMDYYQDTSSLKADILQFHPDNLWRNFRPNEENYEYYHQKALIYDAIINALGSDGPHQDPIGECA